MAAKGATAALLLLLAALLVSAPPTAAAAGAAEQKGGEMNSPPLPPTPFQLPAPPGPSCRRCACGCAVLALVLYCTVCLLLWRWGRAIRREGKLLARAIGLFEGRCEDAGAGFPPADYWIRLDGG
jgi:hypothetical protein